MEEATVSDPHLAMLLDSLTDARDQRREQTAAIKELTADLRARAEADAKRHQEVLDEVRAVDVRQRSDMAFVREHLGRLVTPVQPASDPAVATALHELAEAKKADAAERSWLREKAAAVASRIWPKIEMPVILVLLQALTLASGYLGFKALDFAPTPTPVEIAQPVRVSEEPAATATGVGR